MARFLISILLLCAIRATGQYSADVFLGVPVGARLGYVDSLVYRHWQVDDTADTGPFRTYYIGCRMHSIHKPGAIRLFFYFMGDRLVAKEMRVVIGPSAQDSFQRVAASVRKQYGRPAVDSAATGWGVDGLAKFLSWNFPPKKFYNMDRLDIATYKVIGRQGMIVIGAYANEYNSHINIANDYLHNRPIKYPAHPPPATNENGKRSY